MVSNFRRNCYFFGAVFRFREKCMEYCRNINMFYGSYWIGQSVVFVIVEKANTWVLFLARI
jgi:hypothetical protein